LVLDFSRGFASVDGQQQFGRKIASMVREGRCEPAIKGLYAAIARYPSPVSEAAAATDAEAVEIEGWEALNAALLALADEGAAYTALSVTLSSGAAWALTPEGWSEPVIECGYYTDEAFAFSTSDRTALLYAEMEDVPPWRGAMRPLSAALEIFGLAQINSALAAHGPRHWPEDDSGADLQLAPPAFVAFKLGEWLRVALFHHAVKRGLEAHGLVRRVPVLVGSSETSPAVEGVYFTDTVFSDIARASRRNEDQQIQAKLQYDAYTREQVDLMRQRREAIRHWDEEANPGQRDSLIAFAASHERSLLASQRLPRQRPSWELPDEEFEALIDAFQAARDPDYQPTWRPAPKQKPKGLFKRLGFGGRR